MIINAIMKYPGAKWALADWIIDHFPAHHSYLEPFFGSGAVLFRKRRSTIETVNGLDDREDTDGHLPATFMVVAPGSWTDQVWDDINRMRTLNTTQSQRRQALHVCPLQLDIVDRLINRYSNPGDLVLDPFGGLGTVALESIKAGRRGYTIELNNDYFRDAVGYLKEFEEKEETISLFDVI